MADTQGIVDFQSLTGYVPDEAKKSSDLLDQDVFMNLLVTQLKHQDPLSPMENQEFLQQLASLSTVEQLKKSNENLMTLQLYQSSINNAQSVSMIGKEVKAIGDKLRVAEGEDANIHFALDDAAESVEVTIFDESGKVVRTINQTRLDAGDQTIVWDKKDGNASPVASGTYRFEVRATDSAGNDIGSTTFLAGRVDGVSFGSGGPELLVNGQKVLIGDIYEVNK
ncbi:flagellar hook assembly protein FlgD [bacterium]|nr:flagellar hook assembly protein FlgD [bacterium]